MRIYNRLFSKDKLFVRRLRSLLGFTPANLGIFKLAFYHKSTTSDRVYAVQSNERLEYLGDAVLATIVAEYLFKKYPNSDEGFLTKMRSKIVKRQSLNIIADKMALDVFLNQYNNTRLSKSMLGNALEALVGAVYLEKGYNPTKKFVIGKILLGYLDIHELESYDDNYKSQLLEWCQKNGKVVSYRMVSKYKFEKRDRFKVAVLIDDKKIADADDFNKKSAEQTASERAMKILGIIDTGIDPRPKKQKRSKHSGSERPKEKTRSPKPKPKSENRRNQPHSKSPKRESRSNTNSKTEKKRNIKEAPKSESGDQKSPTTNTRKPAPRNQRTSTSSSTSRPARPARPDNRNKKTENLKPKEQTPDKKIEKIQSSKRNNEKQEDWEDIKIPDIQIVPPTAKSQPAKKTKSNYQANRRSHYKKNLNKKSEDGNPDKSSSKKELMD